MASTIETGHARLINNFDLLIAFLVAYGAVYNPSKAAIKVTALNTQLAGARSALNAVNSAIPNLKTAIAAREAAFAILSKLATRIINALKATDAPDQLVENARTYIRKIQGTRAKAKTVSPADSATETKDIEPRQISTSQMSYDNRLDNFDKLIKLVAGIPLYTPNENDLKVTTLTATFNDLRAKNAAVIAALVPLSNARIARNEALYNPKTGLVATALEVKTYVKSLFGSTSPQYKQISSLEFKSQKF